MRLKIKMKLKTQKIILLSLVVIFLIGGIAYFLINTIPNNPKQNFNTAKVYKEEKNAVKVSSISTRDGFENSNLEDAIIYVGTYSSNFTAYSVKIDRSLNIAKKAESIVNEIGNIIGYNIDLLNVNSSKGDIKIDFKSSSAPFNNSSSYVGNGKELRKIDNSDTLIYTVLDSIKYSIKSYIDKNINVYYLLESKEINIDKPKFNIPLSEAYKTSNDYKNK